MRYENENNRVCHGTYEIKIRAHIRTYVFVYWYDVDATTGNNAIRKLSNRILMLTEAEDRQKLKEEMSFSDDTIDILFQRGEDFVRHWEFIVLRYPDYYDYLNDDKNKDDDV